ncbi:MAG: hypothetical protein DMG15_17125 [Acidobacteria bacterium]|nr:MAG: hypothetical protein DMG16_08150 [Acidobacteriota bacterium]PYS11666.1 MAG: hypothetical protein DMG15_17125 [Acidobacteriota bacterium]
MRGLADLLEHRVLVHRYKPLRVDPGDEVLLRGRLRSQDSPLAASNRRRFAGSGASALIDLHDEL